MEKKFQITNLKLQINLNDQNAEISNKKSVLLFGYWNFEYYLGFGFWCLGFKNLRNIVSIFVVVGAVIFLSSCATVPEGPPTDIIYSPVNPMARQDLYHVIGPAETSYRISKMYDVPIETILKANAIADPRDLKVGQRLLIPDAAPLRPVIPIFKSNKWKYIVVHHSVTDSGDARSLDTIHRRRGFDRGLGYDFVIDNGTNSRIDGQIEASPRWIKQTDGAHCDAGGMNECGIGICLVGDFTHEPPTEKQMDSLVLLINTLRKAYRIPMSHIIRHKDVRGKRTECPGNNFPWEKLKRQLR